ncbi:MAG: glutamate racemase [Elusimicrobiota bacterium]
MTARKSGRAPIGVFDSGVGGLTVVRALLELLPREKFIYVGDTARVPYGTKSPEAVRRYALEITGFLRRRGVKMVVAACNTVSALALPQLRAAAPAPVLGVLEPGARAALAATRTGRVGVVGTEATVRSGAYEEAIRRLDGSVQVFSAACPLLVPLVEEGWLSGPVTRRVATHYLSPLLAKRIDTLVLGCTHYPLLKPVLKETAGAAELIDSAEETAKAVRTRLEQDGLSAPPSARGGCEFFSSDDPAKFTALGRRFLGRVLQKAGRIKLEGVVLPAPGKK